MTGKRSWKKRRLDPADIRAALKSAGSPAAAARALGVNRSTVHRWLKADPSLAEPLARRRKAAKAVEASASGLDPDAWAQKVLSTYTLTDTETMLLELARRCLVIAHDPSSSNAERVSATGRFQRLVIQLSLAEREMAPEPGERTERQAPKKGTRSDPRAVLRAVK